MVILSTWNTVLDTLGYGWPLEVYFYFDDFWIGTFLELIWGLVTFKF